MKTVTASLLWVSLASVCLADIAVVPDAPKEKSSSLPAESSKNKDTSGNLVEDAEKKAADQTLPVTDALNNEIITDHVGKKIG